MTVRFLQPDKYGLYFITFTCYKWLQLIESTKSYDLIYEWFDFLTKNWNYIIGYVIMPNHIHALIAFRNHHRTINSRVGEGKRFIAYGLVKKLQEANHSSVLKMLEQGVNTTDKSRGKIHEVFEPWFDCKECRSNDFAVQKLNYMHNNPCSGKWMLAEDVIDYIHSSARYYETGVQGIYPVTGHLDLDDADLSIKWGKDN